MRKVWLFLAIIAIMLPVLIFADNYVQKRDDAKYMQGYKARSEAFLPPEINNILPHKTAKKVNIEKFRG